MCVGGCALPVYNAYFSGVFLIPQQYILQYSPYYVTVQLIIAAIVTTVPQPLIRLLRMPPVIISLCRAHCFDLEPGLSVQATAITVSRYFFVKRVRIVHAPPGSR